MSLFQPIIDSLAGRKLIVHAGTPKTGTTALQRWLFKQRQWLLEHKILYPDYVSSPDKPKHQWLIDAHRAKGELLLETASRNIRNELTKHGGDKVEAILLSTEGICNHFFDLIQPNKDAWLELTSACPTTIIITFRDPLQYALSRYCQNLINPASQNPYHSTSLSLDDLCNDPTWLQALDYQQMVDFWENLIGDKSLICLAYESNIADYFCRFGLGLNGAPQVNEAEKVNTSIGKLGVNLIRQVNMLGLDRSERNKIIQHIKAAEADLPKGKNYFRHSHSSSQAVLSYCNQRLSRLAVMRPELTPQLKEIAGVSTVAASSDVSCAKPTPATSTAFVCCIQPGFLEEQVIRLAQSIRLFSRSYSQCPIYAVSPYGEDFSQSTLQQLEALNTTLIVKNLNQELRNFPYANKAYAVEYVESYYQHDALVFVDSDTMFVDNPSSLHLDDSVDFLARPVDLRNICCSPLDDMHREYWEACCKLADIQLTDLPIAMSTADKKVIYANWNGGLLMFRGNKEVGARWRCLIEKMWNFKIMAKPNNFWGSGQVSFTIAVASLNMQGYALDASYNIPLHLSDAGVNLERIENPVHIHYHWLLDRDNYKDGRKIFNKLNVSGKVKVFFELLPQYRNKTKRQFTGF